MFKNITNRAHVQTTKPGDTASLSETVMLKRLEERIATDLTIECSPLNPHFLLIRKDIHPEEEPEEEQEPAQETTSEGQKEGSDDTSHVDMASTQAKEHKKGVAERQIEAVLQNKWNDILGDFHLDAKINPEKNVVLSSRVSLEELESSQLTPKTKNDESGSLTDFIKIGAQNLSQSIGALSAKLGASITDQKYSVGTEVAKKFTFFNWSKPITEVDEEHDLCFTSVHEHPIPHNLVFMGGGIRAIAHLGVLKFLAQFGLQNHIKRVIGTSAGSLIALLVALKIPYQKIEDTLLSDVIDWTHLKDIGNSGGRDLNGLAYIGQVLNGVGSLIHEFGACGGVEIEKMIQKAIKIGGFDPEITLSELYEKTGIELIATCTEVETMKTRYLSHATTPDLPVFKAIRTSMNYPFVYKPVKMKRLGVELTYVDGGVLQNFPLEHFDTDKVAGEDKEGLGLDKFRRNLHTLGLMLVGKEERAVDEDHEESPEELERLREMKMNLKGFVSHLISGIITQAGEMGFANERNLRHTYHRIIHVDTLDVKTLDFSIGVEKKMELIRSGFAAAKQFFGNYQYIG